MNGNYVCCDLPDVFIKPDGKRVQTITEWNEHRKYLKDLLSDYLYGNLPPIPETVTGHFCEAVPVYKNKALRERVILEDGNGLRLELFIIRPDDNLAHPVILWNQFADLEICPIEEYAVCQRKYIIAYFKREQFAPDVEGAENFDGGLFGTVYPKYDARAVAIWGWANSFVVSYLLNTPWVDKGKIAVTGHSRGGKAALCAAAFDDRIALCAANASGQGGGGSLRFLGGRLGHGIGQSESIGYLTKRSRFWYWFSDKIQAFGNPDGPSNLGKEDSLPFDLHMIRALIAPRPIICTEGLNDVWSNVYGTQICWRAAQEVYRFLNLESVNALYYQECGHEYNADAWKAVIDFCDSVFFNITPASKYRCFLPNEDDVPALHFNWRSPGII